MHGMLTYEASTTACLSYLGSVTIKSFGSWNLLKEGKIDSASPNYPYNFLYLFISVFYFLVFWLVKVPGVHLDEEVGIAPV
jgi:hypothetical protein